MSLWKMSAVRDDQSDVRKTLPSVASLGVQPKYGKGAELMLQPDRTGLALKYRR